MCPVNDTNKLFSILYLFFLTKFYKLEMEEPPTLANPDLTHPSTLCHNYRKCRLYHRCDVTPTQTCNGSNQRNHRNLK